MSDLPRVTDAAARCTIRDARPEDAEGIAALLVAGLGFPDDGLDHLRARIEHPDPLLRVLVAEQDDRLLGCATFVVVHPLEYPRPQARLSAIVVGQSARRSGVGAALMERVEEESARLGCFRIELTSAHELADAHAFWRHRGYRDSGLRFVRQLQDGHRSESMERA